MVSKLRVIEQNIILFKAGGICRIIIIGIVPNGNIGSLDHILDKARGLVFVGKNLIGVWYLMHNNRPFFFYITPFLRHSMVATALFFLISFIAVYSCDNGSICP